MYPTNILIYCWAVLLFLAVWPPYISEVHRIVKHMLVVMTSRRIKNQMKWKKGVIFNLWKHFQATFVPKPLPVNVNTVWMDYPVAVLAAKSGLGDTITLVVWNNRLLCGEPPPSRSHPTSLYPVLSAPSHLCASHCASERPADTVTLPNQDGKQSSSVALGQAS